MDRLNFFNLFIKKNIKYINSNLTNLFKKTNVDFTKPIFMWGTGRNGSTLLMDLISLNENLCFTSIGKSKYRWKKGIWGDLNHGSDNVDMYKKFKIPIEGMLLNWKSAGLDSNFKRGIVFRDKNNSEIDIDKVKINYSKLDMKSLFTNKKSKRIFDKAGYIMMVDLIDYIFPDSKHIFCIRDPRVVACSYFYLLKNNGFSRFGIDDYNFPGFEDRKYFFSFFENIIWQVEQVFYYAMKYYQFLGDERFIPIRYEDLIDDVEGNIKNIFSKLELNFQNNYFDLLPKNLHKYNLTNKKDKGLYYLDNKLSDMQLNNLKKLEDLAISLGYKDDSFSETIDTFNIKNLKDYFGL